MNSLSMNQDSQTLLSCMEHVLMDWAFLSLDYLGEPGQKPARLPLERCITLAGQHCEVSLVVRGSFGLGLELARSVRGIPASNLRAGETAFTEFCSLLTEEWRRRERSRKDVEWRVLALNPSSPEQWPAQAPDAAIVATVRGLALEVLLWSPTGPARPS
jgi:hypothetical protein